MPNNTGLMLLAGLGALFFLGRGGVAKTDEDNRLTATQRGYPMVPIVPPFDLQGYIDGLFRDTATVPVQPPVQFFFPADTVVTSSGVPGVVTTAPAIITPTTKVQIGGEGGETITASALEIKRSEQIAQQEFEYAANVQPRTWAATSEANRIEEERQRQFAADLIAKNRAAQLARNQAVVAQTRADQERLATPNVEERPPTINFNESDSEWTFNPTATAGQSITIDQSTYASEDEQPDFIDVDFTPEFSESFELSGGMAQPAFTSEDEQPVGAQDYGYGAYYGGGEDE